MRWMLLVACIGCTAPAPDIVAHSIEDAGKPASNTPKGKIPPPEDPGVPKECTKLATTIALLTKGGDLHRYDLATASLIDSGSVKCLPVGQPGAVAVDSYGFPWIASQGTLSMVDPISRECTTNKIDIAPTAITFVHDQKANSDLLYAAVENRLIAIDLATYVTTEITKLPLEDVRSLAGTTDGTVLAFAGELPMTIAEITLPYGKIETFVQVKSPEEQMRFVGGALTPLGVDLVFGATAFRYAEGALKFHAALFPEDPGFLSVGAPPCATWSK